MIVFGWKSQSGAEWSGVLKCEKCWQWGMHYGVRLKRHFTLFFIPLVPLWGNTKVVCGQCNAEHVLGPVEFNEIQHLAEANLQIAIAARNNPERAEELLVQLTEPRWLLPAGGSTFTPARSCDRCGTASATTDKYCASCGSPILL